MKDNYTPLVGSSSSVKKEREFCSFGSVVNYVIAFTQLGAFVSCLIVIGTVGTLQSHLSDYNDPHSDDDANISARHACYMFSKCSGKAIDNSSKCYFKPDVNGECEWTMVGYALVALCVVAFFISAVVKGVLNHKLNWTLYLEVPVMSVVLLLEFSLSLTVSFGYLFTCNSIKKFYGSSDCNQKFPYFDFHYKPLSITAMNSSWFVFMFLFIALVIYIIRLIVFLKRRKKEKIQSAIENESFTDSGKVPSAM